MEALVTRAPFGGAYEGRRAIVTGHTGFKGAWLCAWLRSLGCSVTGLSLAPTDPRALAADPSFANHVDSRIGDIRDRELVARLTEEIAPDYVFHLAAQSLVRPSYEAPAETFETNVGGTVNVLDAVRRTSTRCSVIIVTTDKCYENREWVYGYREVDRLGGRDPYSASKAAAELVTHAYVQSYFATGDVAVSSVRAGNVVGGGDFAVDRILPDAVRAFAKGEPLVLRNPSATRPWQYVLEPLAGYLTVAARQIHEPKLRGAWNFGPDTSNEQPVSTIARLAARDWGEGALVEERPDPTQPHEARLLKIDSTKARTELDWKCVLDMDATIGRSIQIYREVLGGKAAVTAMTDEIRTYSEVARAANLRWTTA